MGGWAHLISFVFRISVICNSGWILIENYLIILEDIRKYDVLTKIMKPYIASL